MRENYYSPSRSSRREQKLKTIARCLLPIAVVGAMLYIPYASMSVTDAYADYQVLVDAGPSKVELAGIKEADDVVAMRQAVGKALDQNQQNEIREVILSNYSTAKLIQQAKRYGPEVLRGNTQSVPAELKQQIRAQLGDSTIQRLKQWLITRQPTMNEVERYARSELGISDTEWEQAQQD